MESLKLPFTRQTAGISFIYLLVNERIEWIFIQSFLFLLFFEKLYKIVDIGFYFAIMLPQHKQKDNLLWKPNS